MFLAIFTFCVGLVVGAYSHKWLASVTGAPANITPASVVAAAKVGVADVAKNLKS